MKVDSYMKLLSLAQKGKGKKLARKARKHYGSATATAVALNIPLDKIQRHWK